MARTIEPTDEPDPPPGDLLQNAQRLVRLQLDLLRAEAGQELQTAGLAVGAMAAGAGLLAAGGLLTIPMAVHLLHRVTRLPLWACYGLAAGACGAAGAGLIAHGRRQAGQVHLPALPESAAALQENLTWLKDQATTLRP